MNVDAFRHVYEYHFSENRALWDTHIMTLTDAQFTQPLAYSQGSVRDQAVHLLNVDTIWFSNLRGLSEPVHECPPDTTDRAIIRHHWDVVEHDMRAYLATLHDAQLMQKPFSEGEDKDLILWQVLLHVITHGTDHRAQLLRQLHDLGCKTSSQDYVFYAYEHAL
jgi:uncharacterized damage-inducible protein DinB